MMAREISMLKRSVRYVQNHKIKSILGCILVFGVIFYGLVFFVAKPVQFSFAGDTCAKQLTFFPDTHREIENDAFDVNFQDKVRIGSFTVASLRTCFLASKEPQAGTVLVQTAPFGGLFARKNFSITIPEAPVANIAALDKPLPVSRDVSLVLSTPDAVYDYHIESGKKKADCEQSNARLACDIPTLDLKQGKKYTLRLARQFNDEPKSVLAKKTVTTLKALKIRKVSIKNDQIVYSKPKKITIKTDKLVAKAKIILKSSGKQQKEHAVKIIPKGKDVTIELSKHLQREKRYDLVIKSIEATDGSTLIEPKKIEFRTSGGPKVTGVDIGASGVDSSAVVTISFDQALEKADIAKFVTLKGGNATVTMQDKTVTVALQGLPRCQAFTLKVAKGLKSRYGITSNDTWTHASRTRCHSVITYGTSMQGRPLQAYIFGNSGPVTMYVGAIHGNEPSSSGLMTEWVKELESHPERLKGKRIVVVPTINPDGIAAGTRTNSRGVNLNRNFPTDDWVKDINDTDGKHKGGGGKKPLSESEAKAIATLTTQYSPRLMLSFHAIGGVVSGDPGEISETYAKKYASLVGYRDVTHAVADTFDYDITGSYEGWAYTKAGVPNIAVELDSYSYYSIDTHRAALWAML